MYICNIKKIEDPLQNRFGTLSQKTGLKHFERRDLGFALKRVLDEYTLFFIRNRFIRNQGSTRQKIKKLEGWIGGDLRNWNWKIGNGPMTEKKKANFTIHVYFPTNSCLRTFRGPQHLHLVIFYI